MKPIIIISISAVCGKKKKAKYRLTTSSNNSRYRVYEKERKKDQFDGKFYNVQK